LGGGGSITITLFKNGTPTALTATGSSLVPAVTSLTGQSVSVLAGDLIALQASGPGMTSGASAIGASLHCH
jgi:hypothetical protein